MQRAAWLLLPVLALACSRSTATQRHAQACSGDDSAAIVNVNVIPMDQDRAVPGQTVRVCNGQIVSVGAGTPLDPSTRVIDGSGKYLMPGLADMHTHLVHQEDLLLYLARGVTTVRNMWGTPMQLEWRQRINAGTLRGPTMVTSGPIVDGEHPVHDGSLVVTTLEEADRVVGMHQRAGYDFIKVYRNLSAPVFNRIMERAKAASIPVAGHIPRAVGLLAAMESGLAAIEHLDGFVDALQSADSPVKGQWEGAAWRKKAEFVDEKGLPELATLMRKRGIWNCPTRVVKEDLGPREVALQRLASAEARYVPPSERAIWRPRDGTPPEELVAGARYLGLYDRFIQALHGAGAPVMVGTDPANPLVVPGFSVHDEIGHLVRLGYSPYEALYAATRGPAEFLHAGAVSGSVAPGQRADLLLLDGNPLQDVAQTRNIAGVMARGRWMDSAQLKGMLEEVAAAYDDATPPFVGRPAMGGEAKKEFSATYTVSWRGTPFGGERIWVGRLPDGARVVEAESYDPHKGQTVKVHTEAQDGHGTRRMVMDSDGASGRGHVEVVRKGGKAMAQGTALPGVEVNLEQDLPQGALLGASQFLAPSVELAAPLNALAVGKDLTASVGEIGLGSGVEFHVATTTYTRLPDEVVAGATVRKFNLQPAMGPRSTLTVDGGGWPVAWEIQAYGSTVRYQRVDGDH